MLKTVSFLAVSSYNGSVGAVLFRPKSAIL